MCLQNVLPDSTRSAMLKYQLIAVLTTVLTLTTTSIGQDSCGETVLWANGSGSHLTSPLYPDAYPNATSCTWTIIAESITEVVVLEMFNIDMPPWDNFMNCNPSFLAIIDGGSTLYGSTSMCYKFPVETYISTGTNMTIVFSSLNNGTYTGFDLYYSAQNKSDFCGSTNLTANVNASVIYSYGYPDKYPVGMDCEWHIMASSSSQAVLLNVNDFAVEGTYQADCSHDNVTVYDGNNSSSPRIDALCGSIYNQQYTSTGQSMTVIFRSDFSARRRNYNEANKFLITYTSHEAPASCKQVSLTATSDNNNVTSPNYPYPYPSNTDCQWYIKAASNSDAVSLSSHVFLAEKFPSDCSDYIKVFDGSSTTSTPLAFACGDSDINVDSISSSLTIIFHSDFEITSSGFSIAYYIKSKPSDWNTAEIAAIVGGCVLAFAVIIVLARLICSNNTTDQSSKPLLADKNKN